MEQIKKFFMELKERADFKFYPVILAPVIIFLLTPIFIKWLPLHFANENSLIENFQLVVILFAFIFCLKAKTDKPFFYSMALVMIILFLREINCGRTVFFLVPGGGPNAFYSWKEIPYGYLAHPLYGLFMVCSGLYFIFSKSYKTLWNYFLHAKLSVYTWAFMFLGIIFGVTGEEIGAFMLEEMAETLFYVSITALLFLQGFNKNYIETTEKYN